MQNISALYDKLIALLPTDSPLLLIVYKIVIAVAGFFILWIILRWLLHFVEKRLKKYGSASISASPMMPICKKPKTSSSK